MKITKVNQRMKKRVTSLQRKETADQKRIRKKIRNQVSLMMSLRLKERSQRRNLLLYSQRQGRTRQHSIGYLQAKCNKKIKK